MNKAVRKTLNVGPVPEDPTNLATWTPEQIRMAGAWSKHEIESVIDPLTARYEWVPDWTGDLDAETINRLVSNWYRAH